MSNFEGARNIANHVPSQIEGEDELMQCLRNKLGPAADHDRLLYHIRSARGKVHWAVNSYLREVMSQPQPMQPNTTPTARVASAQGARQRPAAEVGSSCSGSQCCSQVSQAGSCPPASSPHHSTSESATMQTLPAAGDTSGPVSLDQLPSGVLDSIVRCMDSPAALACLATTCTTLKKVVDQDWVWRDLFHRRWGEVVFPTQPGGPSPSASAAAALRKRLANPPNHPLHPMGQQPAAPPNNVFLGRGVQQQRHRQAEGSASGNTSTSSQTGAGTSAAGSSATHAAAAVTATASAVLMPPPPRPAALSPATQQAISHCDDVSSPPGISPATGCHQAPPAQTALCVCAGSGSHTGAPCVGPQVLSHPETSGAASCPSCCHATVPWKDKYRLQASYEHTRSCPSCGARDGKVVPLVYGFPSPALLDGMRCGRLILGGDHLIDDSHCWVCTACNASFRTYPYEAPHVWQVDHELLRERVAAMKSMIQGQQQQQGGAAGAGAGAAQQQQQAGAGAQVGGAGGVALQGHAGGDLEEAFMLPTYTYEL